MRKSRKGNPSKTFGQCGIMWLAEYYLGQKKSWRASTFMRCTYSGWWGVQWVWFLPAPCSQRFCPHTGVFCTPTHNSHGHKGESESQTLMLNWLRGSWAAGELAGEGDTEALMAWVLHPFFFLSPGIASVPGLALSHGAWAFTPCGRVTGVVMAFIRRWYRVFWEKVESYPSASWGWEVRQAPLGKPWQSKPSREVNAHGWASKTVVKNGKQR